MALREGAALDVLARQPHRVPAGEQRAEGERLAGRPVDVAAGFDGLLAVVEEAADGAVDLEVFRHLGQAAADASQRFERQRR